MSESRRQFIKIAGTGLFATLAVASPEKAFAQKSAPRDTLTPKALLRDDFNRCLNNSFQIAVNNSTSLKMTLDRITGDWKCQCCFTLVFKAQHSTALRQNTYTVSHAKLGTFPMFMVSGADAYGIWYVAVFERLHT